LTSTGADLNGAILSLFQNNITPNPNNVLSDFTEADFTGYLASGAITWGTPVYAPDGTPTVYGDLKTFTAGSPVTQSNVVYGWYITDSPATKVMAARRFDAAININAPSQAVSVVPSIPAFLPE
jgi:hypothetical protein